MMFKAKLKKYRAEILLLVLIILSSLFLCKRSIFIPIGSLKAFYELNLQILGAGIGLYFTAFTIFVGIGLSPRKLDVSKLKESLLSKGMTDKDADELIKEEVLFPYEDNLERAAIGFRESMFVITSLFLFGMVIYSFIIVSEVNHFQCSNNCVDLINNVLFSYVFLSSVFTFYLIYDSAKFLVKIRKLIN